MHEINVKFIQISVDEPQTKKLHDKCRCHKTVKTEVLEAGCEDVMWIELYRDTLGHEDV
jgi:hypothetical protein